MKKRVKTWLEAFRLRTLPLAVSCILLGSFLAASKGSFDSWILTLCLLTTILLQILSNLANDYGDAVSGVDSEERTGPARAVHSGLISREAMRTALIICGGLSFLSGISLIAMAFKDDWWTVAFFLILGLGAIAASVKYTVGKKPYGYSGWGDFFVFIFFGLVGVVGSYYLYTKTFEWVILLPAASCGFFSVAVLNINNIRDIESDSKSGKRSIPVRLGRTKAVWYHLLLLVAGLVCAVIYVYLVPGNRFTLLFLLILPLLLFNGWAVYKRSDAGNLDPLLKQMAITTLLFVLLFGFGQLQL